jgi:hypothetical protein
VGRHTGIGCRLLTVFFLLAGPRFVSAQGCAACYTQAAGSGSQMIQALRSGILVLATPPVICCVGIFWMAYKKRNQFDESSRDESAE